MFRSLIVFIVGALPVGASAQQVHPVSAVSVMGSYAVRVETGCWLEVAPVAADSVRVQLKCRRGPPSYHLGFIDEHLPFRAGMVVYDHQTSGDSGHCQIRIRFRGARAIVSQRDSDLACGFGSGVSADGTYGRTSRSRPAFDLNPIG